MWKFFDITKPIMSYLKVNLIFQNTHTHTKKQTIPVSLAKHDGVLLRCSYCTKSEKETLKCEAMPVGYKGCFLEEDKHTFFRFILFKNEIDCSTKLLFCMYDQANEGCAAGKSSPDARSSSKWAWIQCFQFSYFHLSAALNAFHLLQQHDMCWNPLKVEKLDAFVSF